MRNSLLHVLLVFTVIFSACKSDSKSSENEKEQIMFTGAKGEVKLMTLDPGHFHAALIQAKGEVKLMTLDPGHFHAALIQKVMYQQMNPVVHVYAPDGPDVEDHLKRIEGFNTRTENPTSWDQKVYKGDDFFEKMIAEKRGNLMNVSGNNAKKTEYILKAVEAGINVLADKPMVITPEDFTKLEKAFQVATEKGVLLYDVMTERYEITTILQRALSQIPAVFGTLQMGSLEEPAITKESIHHFFKYVSGNPLKRPAWFFDTQQQGEGLVDVTTHLVDLIQWETFPEVILSKDDIEIVLAKRWTTDLTPEMFERVTHLKNYPDYLKKDVEGEILKVYSNGEINYRLKGVHAKTSVIWNYQAPEGSADTHYSIMRGTKCNLIFAQGEKEGYKPKLYIEATGEEDLTPALNKAIETLSSAYPGISIKKIATKKWVLNTPEKYSIGHEAHFGQVTEKYLRFLKEGKLPEWEVPNMITKYYTTTEGLKMAK